MPQQQAIPTLKFNERTVAVNETLAALPDADPVLRLIKWLSTGNASRAPVRGTVQALIEEGRAFADTPSGRRWLSLLADSPLVKNGWVLWNYLNLDLFLKDVDQSADSPADLVENIIRRMNEDDVEAYLNTLNAAVMAYAALGGAGTGDAANETNA
ncbi:MAG TPA: hypothetical protein ENJ19_07375 [Gammaproteobacteria bacterium]|nr:hypothetical protein [Gammaproteobacteria bacterium]